MTVGPPRGGPRRARRGGFTAVELLVALVLSSVLAGAGWSLVRVHSAASREAGSLGDRLDTTRTVREVLGSEVRSGLEGRDWSLFPGDSLALRAFRGIAVPCGADPKGGVRVRVRARRRTEPARDSILVLRRDGQWRPSALVSAVEVDGSSSSDAGTGCSSAPGDGGWIERWEAPGVDDPGEWVLAKIFERGSYHLADGAFRYRRGWGGRQPLTPAVLDARGSKLGVDRTGAASLPVRLRFVDGSGRPGSATTVVSWIHRP